MLLFQSFSMWHHLFPGQRCSLCWANAGFDALLQHGVRTNGLPPRAARLKAEKQAKQRLRCLLALLFSPVPATLGTYHRNTVRSFRLSHVVLRSCASSTYTIVNWVSKSYSQMHPVGQMNMALTRQGIARRFMTVKETVCRWVESLFDPQFKMRLAARHSSQAEIIEGIVQDGNKMWPNLSAQTGLFVSHKPHVNLLIRHGMKCLSCLSLPRRRVCWGGFTGWLVFWICWLDVCSVRLNDFRSWVHLWQRFPLSSFQRWRSMFDLGKDRSDWDEDPGSLIWISSTRASWVAKKFEQTSGVRMFFPWLRCRCIYFLDSCTYFRKLLENVGLLHVPLGKIEARQKKLAQLPAAGIQWKELLIGSLSLSL